MNQHRFQLTIVLLAVTALFFPTSAFSSTLPSEENASEKLKPNEVLRDKKIKDKIDELKTKAGKDKEVPVIVKLSTSFTPEGKLDSTSKNSQKNKIKQDQDFLLELLTDSPKKIQKFQHVPFIAMTADKKTLEALELSPMVASISENVVYRLNLAQSVPLIGADDAWNSGFSGQGQTIAIIDTGVANTHSAFVGKVVSEACYTSTVPDNPGTPAIDNSVSVCSDGEDPDSIAGEAETGPNTGLPCNASDCFHGSHVAGIAAGNDATIQGVAKDANIISIQVFSEFPDESFCGVGNAPCSGAWTSDIMAGLDRVNSLSGTFDISSVNLSLGFGEFFSVASCDADADASGLKASIDNLRSNEIAVVASSGNQGWMDKMRSPACISSVVSVGATTKSDAIASFSNSASFLDLLAPGVSIFSAVPGGYGTFDGTSMASPHVAGAWAILKSNNPTLTVDSALASLKNTGVSIFDSRNSMNFPRIQVDVALNSLTPSSWFDNAWQYRKQITVDSTQVSSTLTDFTILVSFSDSQLGASALGNGDDILFTSSDGITQLSHEIESWNDTPNSLVAWIKIPTLSSSVDTKIYMYYGNPSATNQEDVPGTWRSEYKAVYHLNDDFNDSTSNNNHCTNEGSSNAIGAIAYSQEFDGIDDVIRCGSDISIDDLWDSGGTVSVWIEADTNGENSLGRIFQKSVNMIYPYGQSGTNTRLGFQTSFDGNFGVWRMNSFTIPFDSWQLFHLTYNSDSTANNAEFWLNGIEKSVFERHTPSGTRLSDSSGNLNIGNFEITSRTWDGKIDEFRMYDGILSSDWISTEYNNQVNPSSFYSIGLEESLPGQCNPDWINCNWQFRKKIVVDSSQVLDDLTDFPMLVKIIDLELSNAQVSGNDILFTSSDGITQLAHEIERWDRDSGLLIAWVKTDLSSFTNTEIFIYYGNQFSPNQENIVGTWNMDYKAVYHLNDDFLDSTSNNRDLINSGSADVPGFIADGQSFDGINDSLFVSGFPFLTEFTISGWIFANDFNFNSWRSWISKGALFDDDTNFSSFVRLRPQNDCMYIGNMYDNAGTNGYIANCPADFSHEYANSWHYVSVTLNQVDNNHKLYVNGNLLRTDIESVLPGNGGQNLRIGMPDTIDSTDDPWQGLIDEVRISNSVRSESWIQTEYNNQVNTGSFYLVGPEEMS